MANPVQTAQMIRLALGSLAADNAHHSFEHLCRHIAKRRIASNVLPATGPVSAGGDQGLDFETFRTYLADELPFALGFLALASGLPGGSGRRWRTVRRPGWGYACGWLMLTSQVMPNLSTTMPNSSPQACFCMGIVVLPPVDSFSQ